MSRKASASTYALWHAGKQNASSHGSVGERLSRSRSAISPPTAPFFDKLNELFAHMGIDANVEQLCRPFHDERTGRPSLAPGICFRLLLGCLPGIDPERGIALTVSHSLGLRRFLGCEPHHNPPDHPTISRTRRRISLEALKPVFAYGPLTES